MFRVRRIYDDTVEANRNAIRQVQSILQQQFHLISPEEIAKLPLLLRDPLSYQFRPILYVAE
jgi:hypothetical protein